MAETQHAPGSFCWAELQTTDAAGAKKFYSELMDWKTTDDEIPGGGTYTMIAKDDGNVGGLYELNEQMRSQGVPSSWMPYVAVADASAAAKKAGELGGKVLMDAFDVMDVGRMAVLQDPSGACFSIWQAKRHHGASHTDKRPGTICWNELATRDLDAASAFYSALFGWERKIQDVPMPYTIFLHGETQRAGWSV